MTDFGCILPHGAKTGGENVCCMVFEGKEFTKDIKKYVRATETKVFQNLFWNVQCLLDFSECGINDAMLLSNTCSNNCVTRLLNFKPLVILFRFHKLISFKQYSYSILSNIHTIALCCSFVLYGVAKAWSKVCLAIFNLCKLLSKDSLDQMQEMFFENICIIFIYTLANTGMPSLQLGIQLNACWKYGSLLAYHLWQSKMSKKFFGWLMNSRSIKKPKMN